MNKLFAAALAAVMISGAAFAGEAEVKKALEPALRAMFSPDIKVESVQKMNGLPLYEVLVGGDVLYTDEKGSFLINGDVFDLKAKRNLTEERKNKLAQINFSDLPLELAIKQVRGNGKRVLASFEDPNCGYCKKLAKELAAMTDVTIYTFLYPILSPDSTVKSKAIWCSPDKAKAWNDWMQHGVDPGSNGKCDNPVDKVAALGRKLNIRGTPAIFLTDGSRMPGFVPAAQLEAAIAKAAPR